VRWREEATAPSKHNITCLLVQRENSGNVAATVTVIGRTPHRDQVVVGEHILVPGKQKKRLGDEARW
jgi:hypothetical protein